jgi:hypothetical protein
MKRRCMTLLAATTLFAMIGVASAMAVGVPEIDNANATFQLKTVGAPVITGCNGEDATAYKKVAANWKGGETDFTPGSTDYSLTGSLKFANGVWTINSATGRGLFKATAKLTNSSGVLQYSGTITLVTQNIAGTQIAAARGWIIAKTYGGDPPNPPGNPDGGSLLANVEASILLNGSFAISGTFGDSPPQQNTPDYSVTTINQTC